MRVLVIGKGGREHAIIKGLASSEMTAEIYALPGNPGMTQAQCHNISPSDAPAVVQFCSEKEIDLVVIGPETPLAEGLSDILRSEGFSVFGPDQRAAQLEASKIVSKLFMKKYNIPTAPFAEVASVAEVKAAAADFTPPYVLKADGLAAGKGVFICQSLDELTEKASLIFEQDYLGSSGHQAILEQFQSGYELSYFILTNGTQYVSLPLAQDHKKLGRGDQGPNTGGMGTVAPMTLSVVDQQRISAEVLERTVAGFKKEGFLYRGVVFIGLMMTEDGPQVLEYNIRFGDPETQVLFPLLEGDWGEVLMTIAKGEIPLVTWKKAFTSCVVVAAENYPGSPVKGVEIKGDLTTETEQAYFLHAGTEEKDGKWLTAGGRVLNAIGVGETHQEAIDQSYKLIERVRWSGMQYRDDIGHQVLKK